VSGATPPIGSLRERLQLLSRTLVAETEGGHGALYVPIATVWGRVHERGYAGFSAIADARAARTTHIVTLRHRSDLSPGDRIVYRGRNLEIVQANDLNGRRAYLSCACAEIRTTG